MHGRIHLRSFLFISSLIFQALLVGACTQSARVRLPQGPGDPLPDYESVFEAAVDQCRRVRTMELTMSLTGRSGETKFRGRVRGALAAPSFIRLEGVAPFGAPAFVLVATPGVATLVLPRDRRVVTEASAAELLQTITGIALEPDDFRAVLTGCVVPDPRPVAALVYDNEWIRVELNGGANLFLRANAGMSLVVAGTRDTFVVEYSEHIRGLPRRARVQSNGTGMLKTDLTATLSQVSINIELNPKVFVAKVPDDYALMTLDELRGRAPLQEDESVPTPDL